MVSRREEVYKVESIGEREGPCGVPLRIEKGVIIQLKRDPCVTGTQGDCRGGNKTIFSVLKRV
jgi:hypothetical protein